MIFVNDHHDMCGYKITYEFEGWDREAVRKVLTLTASDKYAISIHREDSWRDLIILGAPGYITRVIDVPGVSDSPGEPEYLHYEETRHLSRGEQLQYVFTHIRDNDWFED